MHMTRWATKITDLVRYVMHLDRRLDEIKISQGAMLALLNRSKHSTELCDYEFKVFSQWGEDGILQHLIDTLEIKNHTFVEFGVEDFFESNCRFVLMNNGWHGFVIDGSARNIARLRRSYFYWRYPLDCRSAFVTKDNVNSLLQQSGFDRELGILSVDVDGVDWHILKQLEEWRASVIVVEYNALFGAKRAVTVPYRGDFVRSNAHWSNLYYGASLAAFKMHLAERGYALVGVNSAGSNAFFVRRDLLRGDVRERNLSCFREAAFREARDKSGKLLLRSARSCAECVSSLPLIDIETGAQVTVADVL